MSRVPWRVIGMALRDRAALRRIERAEAREYADGPFYTSRAIRRASGTNAPPRFGYGRMAARLPERRK